MVDPTPQWDPTTGFARRSAAIEASLDPHRYLASIIEATPDFVGVSTPDGRLIYINAGGRRMVGLSPDAALEPLSQGTFCPEWVQRRMQREWIPQALQTGSVTGEGALRTLTGVDIPVAFTLHVHRNERGEVEALSTIARDVSERQTSERALRDSEERFRQLAEHIHDVFWITDPYTPRVLYVSPAYEHVWGRSCESLYQNPRSFIEAVHPDDRGRVLDTLSRQVAGTPTAEEYRVLRPDGSVRWVWDRGFPIRDAAGRVIRVAGIAEDITARRRAEEALRQSDARLRRIIESNVIGVVIADSSGRVHEANQAFLHMVGYTEEDVREERVNLLSLTPPEYGDRDARAMAQMREIGRHDPFEKEYIRKDGTRVPVLVGTAFLGFDANGAMHGLGFILELTERRAVEQALRRSEERLRSLMEQAPFSIQIFAPDGRTISVNRAWEELWGATIEQVRDYNILQDAQLEARGVLSLIHRAFAGDVVRIPAIEYDPDKTIPDSSWHEDSRRWVSAVAYPLKDAEGRVREVVLVHEDVTARTRAELALRESDEQFRLMADTIPQLAWMARPDGHIFWYNRRWYEYTGTTPDQMEGWGWQSVHDPRVLPAVLERWRASIRSGEPFDMVFPLRGADGIFRPFLTRVNPLRDEQGVVRRWFGTNTDISEQKQAEDASLFLADASASLALVVDYQQTLQQIAALAVPRFADWCSVDIVGQDGTLRRLAVAHSDPAKVQLAYELQERFPAPQDAPIGARHVATTGEAELRTSLTERDLAAAARNEEHFALLRELGLRSYMSVPMKTRDRVIGVISFAAAESGRHFGPPQLALAEQLAGRAAVAIENARLYEELREADRRKDEFLATLAHELRNPLAPIRTSLQILKMPSTDRPVVQRSLDTIDRQVQHLVRLVEDLLDVSRVMRGKIELRREPVPLATVVANGIETAQPTIDAQGHELTVVLPDEPSAVEADPLRVAQVVSNLLTNAAKYTPAGGHIRLHAAVDGHMVVIRVQDDGIGIATELLPRVFDLFVQADNSMARSQGGLGIGLTLVKNLVQLHGGTVEARSGGPGCGSEFIVRLPVASTPALAHVDHRPGAPPPTAKRQRVLVVDDNVDAGETLAMLLDLMGHDVRVAHDGPSALAAAQQFAPSLVLLDLGMPKMDGYDVAAALRRDPRTRDVLLAAVTGWGQEQDRRRTADAGFDVHLVKPLEPSALERLLEHPRLVR